jgi:hypothetical protein
MLSTLYLAAEDELGLAVGQRLVAEVPPLTVYLAENGRGFGRLKQRVPAFQQMGQHMPVLLLTDLDAQPCAASILADWLGTAPSPGFLFRVCVREIEAWLLAHREAMAKLLRIPITKLPLQPELISDPKRLLIGLAKQAPKRIRTELVPTGTAAIGPGYNDVLGDFVRHDWSHPAPRSPPQVWRGQDTGSSSSPSG